MDLRPCQDCQRHVRRDESSCPFCGVALAPAPRRVVPDVSNLSRSGRMALGAALAAALALPACGGGNTDTKTPDPVPEENIAPPYGIPPEGEQPPPPDPGASDAGSAETPPPDGVPAAMYGVPPPQ